MEIHESLDSTNILAKQRAIDGVEDGYVIVADTQTNGRGRRGRSWHSPAGVNLYLSMVLDTKKVSAGLVSLMGAVAVMDTIKQLCPNPDLVQIKWPNDVLMGRKKVAGVLGEYLSEKQDWCVLGIGVNVNSKAEDLPDSPRWPATSIALFLGKQLNRNILLSRLVCRLRDLKHTLETDHEKILEQVRQNSATIGRTVLLSVQNTEPQKYKAIGIDENGLLLLQGQEKIITVTAGDVDIIQDNR